VSVGTHAVACTAPRVLALAVGCGSCCLCKACCATSSYIASTAAAFRTNRGYGDACKTAPDLRQSHRYQHTARPYTHRTGGHQGLDDTRNFWELCTKSGTPEHCCHSFQIQSLCSCSAAGAFAHCNQAPAAGSCCFLQTDTDLEAVNLDELLLDQLLLGQELQDVLALIALQLNDLHACVHYRTCRK
jgi:hypothetical protein